MGKRNAMNSLDVQMNDYTRPSTKRLRTPTDPPATTDAALTLLSLKKEAVCFPSSFSPITTKVTGPYPACLFQQEEDEHTMMSKSSASSVSSSTESVTDDNERYEYGLCPTRNIYAIPSPQPRCTTTVTPLCKPVLCRLHDQTKEQQDHRSTSTNNTIGFFCRPLPPPPKLPTFLVRSSYPPFALPRRGLGKTAPH
jgi:hypothetical protein